MNSIILKCLFNRKFHKKYVLGDLWLTNKIRGSHLSLNISFLWTWMQKLMTALLLSLSFNTYADLPLTIEELLTKSKTFRLEWGLSYANSQRNQINTHFDIIQTTSDNQVLLPINVTEQHQNSDLVSLNLGLRYGYSVDTEFYARLIGMAQDNRWQNNGTAENNKFPLESQKSQQWQDLTLGVNYRFSTDNETPALIGFVEISAAEHFGHSSKKYLYARSGRVGFTAYRTVDPIVLSLTSGYRFALSRQRNDLTLNPGDLFFINPSVGFAVNNEVTLTGGVQFNIRGKDTIADSAVSPRTTQTQLEFGIGYGIAEKLTLNVNINTDISGQQGSQSSVNFTYKFNK